ncbi:hypothetical protein Anas_07442 [Armadillidium nasatum]|uniref:Uncharacterized protein n=1 Tax=Armadillidium nasatum TaxID=96803 RepID=A0A5N5SVY6_9CRUS|nr:hypothetical protein Anas_07442 [Armadillidium nasatum]
MELGNDEISSCVFNILNPNFEHHNGQVCLFGINEESFIKMLKSIKSYFLNQNMMEEFSETCSSVSSEMELPELLPTIEENENFHKYNIPFLTWV